MTEHISYELPPAEQMARAVRRETLKAELKQIDLAIAAERQRPDTLGLIAEELKELLPDVPWFRNDEFKEIAGEFFDFEVSFKQSGPSLVSASLTVYEISVGFALSVPDALLILAKRLNEVSDRITRQITPKSTKENHGTSNENVE